MFYEGKKIIINTADYNHMETSGIRYFAPKFDAIPNPEFKRSVLFSGFANNGIRSIFQRDYYQESLLWNMAGTWKLVLPEVLPADFPEEAEHMDWIIVRLPECKWLNPCHLDPRLLQGSPAAPVG